MQSVWHFVQLSVFFFFFTYSKQIMLTYKVVLNVTTSLVAVKGHQLVSSVMSAVDIPKVLMNTILALATVGEQACLVFWPSKPDTINDICMSFLLVF